MLRDVAKLCVTPHSCVCVLSLSPSASNWDVSGSAFNLYFGDGTLLELLASYFQLTCHSYVYVILCSLLYRLCNFPRGCMIFVG